MRKSILTLALAAGALTLSAQAIQKPAFFDNWSIGLDGGVTTPMNHHAFFGSMRGVAGLHIQKQVTPAFALGVEGAFGVNTSSWKGMIHSTTAFDNSYVGMYGAVDLFNLFGGYKCGVRPFTIEAVAGAGWGHYYINNPTELSTRVDQNFFATKAGLNFNFNVCPEVTISLKPYVAWNMTGGNWEGATAAYDINKATFNLMAGVTYNFGPGFECVKPFNQAEIDDLNGQINGLRAQLADTKANADANAAKAAQLARELSDCMNKKPEVEVVKEVSNLYNSVRFVFFRVGSYKVTADQMPNVEMIADYMKNHKDAKVIIKGYASPEGNYDFNVKLAQNRAESVKKLLISKYGIAADRITAQGEGIGNMFSEDSWNRVSICTLEEK